MNTAKLIDRFTTLLLEADPSVADVEIRITRKVIQYHAETITKARAEPGSELCSQARPTEAPPAPADEPARRIDRQRGVRLTREQAATIKAKIAMGARNVQLAGSYGVSQELVSGIRSGRIWKSVPWPQTEDTDCA